MFSSHVPAQPRRAGTGCSALVFFVAAAVNAASLARTDVVAREPPLQFQISEGRILNAFF